MSNILDSIDTIRNGLVSYIKKTFPVDMAFDFSNEESEAGRTDPSGIVSKLDAFLNEEGQFVKDPYVERQVPYEESVKSLADMEEDGLDEDVAVAFSRYLGGSPDRIHLYTHQHDAFSAVTGGKNLVVCTGTGSGKTESFLLPIINSIVKKRKEYKQNNETYPCGVRAMILYPMNALVNDQVRRLRSVIRELPEELRPTFGLYTGELSLKDEPLDDTTLSRAKNALLPKGNDGSPVFPKMVPNDGVAQIPDEDIPLTCELRHRWQWVRKGVGPADILVTNYAMLERLLLLPEASPIFSETWQFIVVDEAHSYTGAMGTEIAWLLRRVQKRVGGGEGMRFIATSATLRNAEDGTQEENETWIKENFASKFFPAQAGSFEVKFGKRKAEPQRQEEVSPADCDVVALALNGACDNLFNDTVDYFGRKKTNDAKIHLLKSCGLENVAKKGPPFLSANRAFHLLCDLPNLDCSLPAIRVTENVKRLIDLVFSIFGEKDKDWEDMLHDPLDPRGSGRRDAHERPIYRGNRLAIKDEWNEARNGGVQSLSNEAFQYLYTYSCIAANECETELADKEDQAFLSALDIPNYHVEIAFEPDCLLPKLLDFVTKTGKDKAELDKELQTIQSRWIKQFGKIGDDICDIIYNLLDTRNDVARIRQVDFGKCRDLGQIAKEVYPDIAVEDGRKRLLAVFQLGMVAKPKNGRHPMFDIRYHVMARGLDDVSQSFPEGLIENMRIERSTEPNDAEGNMRFSIGVCRKCGQPFILGYSEVQELEDDSQLVREYTGKYSFLHALAWTRGSQAAAEDAGNEQDPEDGEGKEKETYRPPIYVNLRNGRCSRQEEDGYTKMVWARHSEEKDRSQFISTCPNCGCRDDNDNAVFGIITPFGSTGDSQLRFEILKQFAISSEEETDPAIRELPGNGRKVLAFSDTRNGAATLASNFDETYRRQFMNKVVCDWVGNGREDVVWDDDNARRDYDKYVRKNKLSTANDIKEEHFRAFPKTPFAFGEVVARDNLDKLGYYLQVTKENSPSELLSWPDAAKWAIMRALRDMARDGLLKSGVVKIMHQKVAHEAQNRKLAISQYSGASQESLDVLNSHIEDLYQHIFEYLFKVAKMVVPADWPQVDVRPTWKNPIAFWDGPSIKGVANFKTSRRIGKIIWEFFAKYGVEAPKGKALDKIRQGIFDDFADEKLGILINDGKRDKVTTYCLSAKTLINDIVLESGNGKQRDVLGNAPSLRIEEHTAQISPEQGRVYQSAFQNGRVNILSCSTTFEMGIDLGALNRVFLANVPPSTANYRQRAGRAGRRPGASPFILTYAGSSPHDRYYFDHPSKMLDGEISPPCIYLEKPSFRARHLRAEMLHQFLVWLTSAHVPANNARTQGNGNGRRRRDWRKLNDFFIGFEFHKSRVDGTVRADSGSSIVDLLETWFGEPQGKAIRAEAVAFADVPSPLGYDVAKDLAFQLTGAAGWRPYEFIRAHHLDYLNLLGPNMPVKAKDGVDLADADDPRRQCAKKRIEAKLKQYLVLDQLGQDEDNHAQDGIRFKIADAESVKEAGACDYCVTLRQRSFLNQDTIKYLSSCNVLPKYGFPVDVIEMEPPWNDQHGHEVRLQRDMQLGLYEYAPDQIVRANKRRYRSVGYSATHIGDPGEWYKCGTCGRLATSVNGIKCIYCGGVVSKVSPGPDKFPTFQRPDVFISELARMDRFKPRGDSYQTYAGSVAPGTERQIDGCAVGIAESDTQMMRFLNAGPHSCGFNVVICKDGFRRLPDGKCTGDKSSDYLVHDIVTNIAILTIPDSVLQTSDGQPLFGEIGLDEERCANAMRSAMYAIRRAMARRFQVADRDIGVLLNEDGRMHGGRYSMVFFDTASGGGGLVLQLLEKTSPIREILADAKTVCDCDECGQDIKHQGREDWKPVDEADYRNELQDATANNREPLRQRLRAACPKCLKQRGIYDAHLLDRFDAAKVIENMLNPALAGPASNEDVLSNPSVTPSAQDDESHSANLTVFFEEADYCDGDYKDVWQDLDEDCPESLRDSLLRLVPTFNTRERPYRDVAFSIDRKPRIWSQFAWKKSKVALFSSDNQLGQNELNGVDGWKAFLLSDQLSVKTLLGAIMIKEE